MRILGIVLATLLVVGVAAEAQPRRPDFPPWAKIGQQMQVENPAGFWKLWSDKKRTKFWVEIPGNHCTGRRPIMIATTISGGSAQTGWQWRDHLIVLKKVDKQLVALNREVQIRAGAAGTLTSVVNRTYTDRVLATFPIMARGPHGGWVVDGKRFFGSSATLWFGPIGRNRGMAEFNGSKSYPGNTEIRMRVPRASDGRLIDLHYSVSALQGSRGYRPRNADDRIGYFTTEIKDFSQKNQDDYRMVRYINRWNLKKMDPKAKLSEPRTPIIFYIEKTVPYGLRRYVKQGILEWNKAFEKVGILDAIVVRQQTNDRFQDLEPEDINYNFFRWIASERAFAMGPSRVNPTTGEILDADIIFDDDYLRYSVRDYRIRIQEMPKTAIGPLTEKMLPLHPWGGKDGLRVAEDPFIRELKRSREFCGNPHQCRAFCGIGHGMRDQLTMAGLWLGKLGAPMKPGAFPEEFVGEILKDTVMHEVGHTLGLRHNFKASSWRKMTELSKDGGNPGDLSASVMDYNAIPITADPKQQGHYAMTTIGPYDYWAIQYGYTPHDKDLKKITSRVAEAGLDFATDEDTYNTDPYTNRWDMGAEPLNFSKEMLKLLNRLKGEIVQRTVAKGERYNRLRRAVGMLLGGGRRAGLWAVRYVGGERVHRDHRGDPNERPTFVPVEPEKQRAALKFVCDEFLSGKYFDFSPDLLSKLAPDFWRSQGFLSFLNDSFSYQGQVLLVQRSLILSLMGSNRLWRVLESRNLTPMDKDVFTVPEIFDSLEATIFGGTAAAAKGESSNQKPALSAMRRNLQRSYVDHINFMLLRGTAYPATVQTLARHYVGRLKKICKESLAAGGDTLDTYTKAHLEECHERLRRTLEASYTLSR